MNTLGLPDWEDVSVEQKVRDIRITARYLVDKPDSRSVYAVAVGG